MLKEEKKKKKKERQLEGGEAGGNDSYLVSNKMVESIEGKAWIMTN